jgi:hypothetical protein
MSSKKMPPRHHRFQAGRSPHNEGGLQPIVAQVSWRHGVLAVQSFWPRPALANGSPNAIALSQGAMRNFGFGTEK